LVRFVVYSCGAVPVLQPPAAMELIFPPLLIYLTEEELDRATEVLNNLKLREERNTTPTTALSYEFLRKLDEETLYSSHRQNTVVPAILKNKEQQVALPPWWNEEIAILSLDPPIQSPLLALEQSGCTTTSSDDLHLLDKDFKDERLRLGVRLLKMDKIEQETCQGKFNSSIKLLRCPAVFNQDSTSSIASSLSSLFTPLPPPALPMLNMLPSGDLADVVNKLRRMTALVAKLQLTLGKYLETKEVQQQKGNEHENFKIRLTRF